MRSQTCSCGRGGEAAEKRFPVTATTYKQHVANPEIRNVLLLLAIFVAAFCVNLFFSRDLWVQDEARYGEVVREMIASHDWFVPHLNDYPYPDKPPVYFWMVAAVSAIVGQGELAFRLVTVFSTLGAISGVYLLGRALAGREEAFWSAALFSTTSLTLLVGQIVRMDMLLTVAVVFAWYALHKFYASGSRGGLVAFWALSALALAVKGPIALLFTVIPGLAWLTWENGWSGLWSMRPLLGLSAIAAMVGVWSAVVISQGQQHYLDIIWNKQLVGRAVNSWSHKEPFYFYLALSPVLFMPWTGLIAHGGHALFRSRPLHWKGILLFAILPLVGISMVSGKLFIYMEPLVPACCIAGGIAATGIVQRSQVSRWATWPPVVFIATLATAIIFISVKQLEHQAWQGYAVGTVLGLLALIGGFLTQANGRRWLSGWLGISLVLSWLVFGVLAHVLNPFFSGRALGQFVAQLASPDRPIAVVHDTRGILNYYAGRTFTEVELASAQAWLKAHPDAVIIVKDSNLQAVLEGDNRAKASCAVDKTFLVLLKEYHVLADCQP
jgi:4-amino-4-deoxy-L-arabinose transferase-like glycosyltransferase